MEPPLTELHDMARSGQLQAIVGAVYPLTDAAGAHRELLARRTAGKLVLDTRH